MEIALASYYTERMPITNVIAMYTLMGIRFIIFIFKHVIFLFVWWSIT